MLYIGEKKAGEVTTTRYLSLIYDFKQRYGAEVGRPPNTPAKMLNGQKNCYSETIKLNIHPARQKPKRPITQCYWDMVDLSGIKTIRALADRAGTTKIHVIRLLNGVVLIKRDGLIKQGQAMGLSLCQITKIMRKNKLNTWADYIAERWLTDGEIREVECPWAGANFSNEVYK